MNCSNGIWRSAARLGPAVPVSRRHGVSRCLPVPSGFFDHRLESSDQEFAEGYLIWIRPISRHPRIDELPPEELIGGQSGEKPDFLARKL